jgi:DNA-binding XRE family transcriptional regulator
MNQVKVRFDRFSGLEGTGQAVRRWPPEFARHRQPTQPQQMMNHKELVRKMLKQPAVKFEYDGQAEDFGLLEELLRARRRAGLTQAEVAARMGTKTTAVARLEAGGGNQRHSPSVATLRKYAQAVGCRVEIRLRPQGGRKSKAEPSA